MRLIAMVDNISIVNCSIKVTSVKCITKQIKKTSIWQGISHSLKNVTAGPSRATAGPGETFSLGPQTFLPSPSRKNNFDFFFPKWFILMYFGISERRQGPPNVAGPRAAYPLPHPLDGPAWLDKTNTAKTNDNRDLTYCCLSPNNRLIINFQKVN